MVIHQCIEMVNHSRSSSLNSCSPAPYMAVNFCPEIETLATVPYMAVSIYVLMSRYHTFNIIQTTSVCHLFKLIFWKIICADFVHAFNQPKKPLKRGLSDIVQLSTCEVPTTTSGVTAEEPTQKSQSKAWEFSHTSKKRQHWRRQIFSSKKLAEKIEAAIFRRLVQT